MAFASSPVSPSTSLHTTPPSSSPASAGSLETVDENGLLTDKSASVNSGGIIPTEKIQDVTSAPIVRSLSVVIGPNGKFKHFAMNDELTFQSHWSFTDPFMSQRHLRVYTMITKNNRAASETLVYAQDLSRNGVH